MAQGRLWSVAVLFTVLGCGGSNDGDKNRGAGESCDSWRDCEDGLICYQGTCFGACNVPEDCARGVGCVRGLCTQCELDDQCSGFYLCDPTEGRCTTSCGGDAECQVGGICAEGGTCEAPRLNGEDCGRDAMCASLTCWNNTTCCPAECVNGCDGSRCLSAPGALCELGVECSSGACMGGMCCATACEGVCDETGRCLVATGDLCERGSDCELGFCSDGVCCDAACDGPCEECARPSLVGQCSPLTMVEDSQCHFSEDGAQMCDAQGACQVPHMLLDINPSGGPSQFVALPSGVLVFEANAAGMGRELWRAEGATASVLADIRSGPVGSNIQGLTRIGNYAVFWANDGTGAVDKLRGTDGSSQWAIPAPATGAPATHGPLFHELGGWLYFVAENSPAGSKNYELWRTNGTLLQYYEINSAGCAFCGQADIFHAYAPYERFDVVDGALYFVAKGASNIRHLWRKAADNSTPEEVAGSVELSERSYESTYTLPQRRDSGGWLYLKSDDGTVGEEPCRGNGTTVELVTNIRPGNFDSFPWSFTVFQGWVYFTVVPATGGIRRQLWRTNGAQTGEFAVIDPNGGSSHITSLTVIGDRLFFVADDGTHGSEPWVTDGTVSGTHLLKEINPNAGQCSNCIRILATASSSSGTTVFFTANDGGVDGIELWRSDGTSEGTIKLTSYPGERGSNPTLLVVSDYVYFALDTVDYGRELVYWHPTGDDHGVIDITPGPRGSFPSAAVIVPGTNDVVVSAFDGDKHVLLTIPLAAEPAGTVPRAAVYYGSEGSSPRAFAKSPSGHIYFSADDALHGNELWSSDGTANGTSLLQDITTVPGSYHGGLSSEIDHIGFLGDKLFFDVMQEGGDFDVGNLWTSDGQPSGAEQLFQVIDSVEYPVFYYRGGYDPALELVPCPGAARMCFPARTEDPGMPGDLSLYASDGTPAGTEILGQLVVDSAISSARHLGAYGGYLYFSGPDGGSTIGQLWRTDGTKAGTALFKTLRPGVDALVRDFVVRGNTLYFLARDVDGADKVWSSDGTPAGTVPVFGNTVLTLSELMVYHEQLWLVSKDGGGTRQLGHLVEPGFTLENLMTVSDAAAQGSFLPTVVGDYLFFRSQNAAQQAWNELWYSDGMHAYAACGSGYGCRNPSAFAVLDGRLFVQADLGSGPEVIVFP